MSTLEHSINKVYKRSGEMREGLRFFITILLITAPILIAFGLLEMVAWQVGETMSMQAIAEWQSREPERMWRGGDGRSYLAYKVARVRQLKPQIIMLGQSRANSFRGESLKPYSFFNSGLVAWTFSHYRRYLELVTADGYAPKALFFNFDYWMFSKGFDKYWVERFYEEPPTHWEGLKVIIEQLQKDPTALYRTLPATHKLKGLYAVLSGDGFRQDGSLGGAVPTPDPNRLANDGTAVGGPPVELGDGFDDEQLAAFERFVSFAKSRNIALIGLQAPFYAKILYGLNQESRAGIWREFRSDARHAYFEGKGIIFFDFADMPEYREKPEYFVDSLHPDFRIFADIVRRMLSDPRVRAVLPDLQSGT